MTDDACVVTLIMSDLCDPMDCSSPGSSGLEFSRQDCWSGWPFRPPVHLPNPGIEPLSLASPALAGGFFTAGATWASVSVSPGEALGELVWPQDADHELEEVNVQSWHLLMN